MSKRCPSTKEQHLCVFHEEKSTCYGDSGGPLTVDEGGFRVVVGVVNYAANFDFDNPDLDRRCEKGLVDVFTKVQAFLPWIKNISGIGELLSHVRE